MIRKQSRQRDVRKQKDAPQQDQGKQVAGEAGPPPQARPALPYQPPGKFDVIGRIPEGIRIDPDVTEGHPGYEESGSSEIIPPERLGAGTEQPAPTRGAGGVVPEEWTGVLDELIEVLQAQARELENLVIHVEQVTRRLPEEGKMAMIRSTLTGLHQRVRQLRGSVAARD